MSLQMVGSAILSAALIQCAVKRSKPEKSELTMSSLPNLRPIYDSKVSAPVIDEKYKAWIRTLPCAVPGCRRRHSEAAHTGGHGMKQKASDRRTIPLCRSHHLEYHGPGGRRRFEHVHRLDIEALIVKLNEKPFVRLMGGLWIAILGGEEYTIGKSGDSLAVVQRAAIAIARERPLIMRL